MAGRSKRHLFEEIEYEKPIKRPKADPTILDAEKERKEEEKLLTDIGYMAKIIQLEEIIKKLESECLKEREIVIEREFKREALNKTHHDKNIREIDNLCTNISTTFDMPQLRNLTYHLIKSDQIKTISVFDLENIPRRELCKKLAAELHLTSLNEEKFLKPPYKYIEEIDIDDVKSIPSWIWEPTLKEIMFGSGKWPYTISTGNAYTKATIDSLHDKKDPKTRAKFKGKPYESWNLKEASKDFIFRQTGFTSEELEKQKLHDIDFFFNLGLLFYNSNDFKKSLENFTKIIELNPLEPEYWSDRGILYSNIEDYGRAIEDFTKAIKLNPLEPTYWYNRGSTYYDIKEYKQAIEDNTKAIELNSLNPDYWYNRAMIYKKLNMKAEALRDIEECLKIDPDNSLCKKFEP